MTLYVPRIVQNGPTGIDLLGHKIDLSGFRYNGSPINGKPTPTDLTTPNPTIDYQTAADRIGISVPALGTGELIWVAIFAYIPIGETTPRFGFLPYLTVDSVSVSPAGAPSETEVTFESNIGTLTGEFSDVDVLVCSAGGTYKPYLAKCTADLDTKIRIFGTSHGLSSGDVLLLAPQKASSYQYIGAIQLEESPGVTPINAEWRNFIFMGNGIVGSSGPQIDATVSTSFTNLWLRNYISPLATGAILDLQAQWTTGSNPGAAYAYISHDSSPHTVAMIGNDNPHAINAGGSGTRIFPVNPTHSSYWSVNNANIQGRAFFRGFVEL